MYYNYNDYYENYELNNGVYSCCLTDIDKQILDIAIWIVDNKISIRQAEKEFNRSRSAIHKDMNIKLKDLSFELYRCVKTQFNHNKSKYFK